MLQYSPQPSILLTLLSPLLFLFPRTLICIPDTCSPFYHTTTSPDSTADGSKSQSSSSVTLKTSTTAATSSTTTTASVSATTTTAPAISGDGILTLLQTWGAESTTANLTTSAGVKGNNGGSNSSSSVVEGGGSDGYDGLKALAQQLASSRAKSCTNLRNILQHKLESLKELL